MQVLLQTLRGTLAPRYLAAAPSAARLPGLRLAVAVVSATAWELCRAAGAGGRVRAPGSRALCAKLAARWRASRRWGFVRAFRGLAWRSGEWRSASTVCLRRVAGAT
jgi:hypothetical protein